MESTARSLVARSRAVASAVAMLVVVVMVFGAIPHVTADTKSKSRGRSLTEDQKVLHVLNRLAFGPRPGDLERVKQIGLEKYIEQQLRPEKIEDSQVEARLAGLDSLRLTVAQLYEKYPQPNMIARALGLRPGNNAAPAPQPPSPADPKNPAMESDPGQFQQEDRERRERIRAYYAEEGLKPPQALLQELQAQKIIRAAYSERQFQEVMTDFWFNHFNIYWQKGADRWLTTSYEMNAIRPNTLGKFKNLLMATAKSPAMLFYLDNFQSMTPNPRMPGSRTGGQDMAPQNRRRLLGGNNRRRIGQQRMDQQSMDQQRMAAPGQPPYQLLNRQRGINENYAREIMELHTLGVDGGYTQKDVQEVARAFTGWTIDQPRRSGQFIFRERMHDDGEKVVLGQKIPAGGGIEDGEKVVEILARHPNTAKFISTKLVRRFVNDNPPAPLVEKVAAVYLKTDGDIREMLATIFKSPEFFAPENYRAKIKSPFELAVSSLRALGGDTNGSRQTAQFIAKMGQPLYAYQAPTGYPDRAEQWVNTGALLERLNFGIALSSNRVQGTSVDIKSFTTGLEPADSGRVLEKAIAVLLNGDVSQQTRTILEKQLREGVAVAGELKSGAEAGDAMMASDAGGIKAGKATRRAQRTDMDVWGRRGDRLAAGSKVDPQVSKVFGLVLGSPDFQRR